MAHPARLTAVLLLLLAACAAEPEAPRAEAPAPADALVMEAPRRAVLRPAGGTAPRRLWRDGEGLALETEGPRVVATAGLGPALMGTGLDGADPMADPRAIPPSGLVARRVVDLGDDRRDPAAMRFGVLLSCTLVPRAEGAWLLVEEACRGDGVSFAGRFRAEASTGRVVASEQWAGEGLPALLLRHPLP